jgi:hypothetical protein
MLIRQRANPGLHMLFRSCKHYRQGSASLYHIERPGAFTGTNDSRPCAWMLPKRNGAGVFWLPGGDEDAETIT